MNQKQIETLSVIAAEKKGVRANTVHWRVRDMLVKDEMATIESRRPAKGADPVDFIVATPKARQLLKAQAKAAAKAAKAPATA